MSDETDHLAGLKGPPEKCPLPAELMTPSQKGKDSIDEMVAEFGKDAETAGPTSDFGARERVIIKRGKGKVAKPTADMSPRVDGKAGEVVAQSFIGGSESAHAGEVCRAVQLDSGAVVCTAEKNLKRERSTSAGFTAAFGAGWDLIFGRKRKRP